MILELGVVLRHYRVVVTRNRHDPEFGPESHGSRELGHFHVDDRRVVLQFENRHLELSAREIHSLRRDRPFQQRRDLTCGNPFGIEHQVNAHFRKEVFVLVREEFFIVNAGAHFLAAEFLGQERAHDIDVLRCAGIYGNEQVRIFHTCVSQNIDG